MDDVTLKLDGGALLEVPVFEKDECGRNWLAILECRDRQAPGGFRRTFCFRLGHPYYYDVKNVKVGQAIEFGADRVSLKLMRAGRKRPKRAYGVVKAITEESLTYSPQPSALAALAVAATINQGPARLRKLHLD